MSVVVKGMEMPNTCEECQVSCEVGSDLYCQVTDDGKKWGWKKSENGFYSRPDWCPLRPLPEKHGRLIDADAMKRIWMGARIDGDIGVLLDARPTVVEAEGD